MLCLPGSESVPRHKLPSAVDLLCLCFAVFPWHGVHPGHVVDFAGSPCVESSAREQCSRDRRQRPGEGMLAYVAARCFRCCRYDDDEDIVGMLYWV